MATRREELEKRMQELIDAAEAGHIQWRDEAARLPEGDVVARIGLLASLLGVNAGVALDPGVALDEALHRSA